MSIRPVDLQVMIPKTTDVANNQHHAVARNDVHHNAAANALQQQAEKHVKNVYASDETAKSKIREKQERQNKKYKNKNSKDNQDTHDIENNDAMSAQKFVASGNNKIDILV